jgi:hypothetical protein
LNVVFVFVLLKLFFYELGKKITAFDILFAGVVLTRFISYALHDDKLLLSLTNFIASFFSFLLCVDGQFVMPAVVSFMLLSLNGSCFLYSTSMIDSLDATPMVSLACIIFVAAALLSFPNGKEEEKELKNRIWLLVFFVVQGAGAVYVLYAVRYDASSTMESVHLVSMMTRIFVSVSCVGKTFDNLESNHLG